MRMRKRQKRNSRRFSTGPRRWRRKFADAFLGLRQSIHQQSSYVVHFAAAVLVVVSAWWLGNFDAPRWCLLILCMTVVIGAEMLNTSIETLGKAITRSYHPLVGRALNIASGAVLVFALGAALVGLILFGESLWKIYAGARYD